MSRAFTRRKGAGVKGKAKQHPAPKGKRTRYERCRWPRRARTPAGRRVTGHAHDPAAVVGGSFFEPETCRLLRSPALPSGTGRIACRPTAGHTSIPMIQPPKCCIWRIGSPGHGAPAAIALVR
jgi:hypothetical protein